jgi:hypothetical protein
VKVVDRPAEAPGQIAQATTEGKPGDPDLGEETKHRGKPMLLGGMVDVFELTPGTDPGKLGPGVDRDLTHVRHVQGEAAVGKSCPGDVMAASFDAQQQPVLTGEQNAGGDTAR